MNAATAALVPAATSIFSPLTRTFRRSGIRIFHKLPRREIRFRGDFRFARQQMIRNEASGCQRSRNAESFVASRKEERRVVGIRTDEWKLVWSSGAETRPGANRRSVAESRQIF